MFSTPLLTSSEAKESNSAPNLPRTSSFASLSTDGLKVRRNVSFRDLANPGDSLATYMKFDSSHPPSFCNKDSSKLLSPSPASPDDNDYDLDDGLSLLPITDKQHDPYADNNKPKTQAETGIILHVAPIGTQHSMVFSDKCPDETKPVSLLSAKYQLDGLTKAIVGSIMVQNLAYHKKVFVRFTDDSWRTSLDIPAKYNRSRPGKLRGASVGIDIFTFAIPVSVRVTTFGARIEFVVAYEVDGKTHWDNNKGTNYKATPVTANHPRVGREDAVAKRRTVSTGDVDGVKTVDDTTRPAFVMGSAEVVVDGPLSSLVKEIHLGDSLKEGPRDVPMFSMAEASESDSGSDMDSPQPRTATWMSVGVFKFGDATVVEVGDGNGEKRNRFTGKTEKTRTKDRFGPPVATS